MRKIIHIDMDCFFAAIEVRDHPHLKGKPVAVGGSSKKRGVLSTANYEARKYGVHSAMPTSRALRLCPNLILMPSRFDAYREASQIVKDIFKEYTDVIEPLSLDEAFLDVSDNEHCTGSATLIAQEIRKKIFERTQLTASAGIAPNKFLAKVASDWKKPNGQFVVKPEDIDDFMLELPIKKIPGVGKVAQAKLESIGLKTCGDMQSLSMSELKQVMGKYGAKLYDLCRGIDNRPVKSHWKRKSLSCERTYGNDLQNLKECLEKVDSLYNELVHRLDKKKYTPEDFKGLVVKVKFFDFQVASVSSAEAEFSLSSFKELVKKGFQKETKPVRLIGLGVYLKDKEKDNSIQMNLFS